MLRVDRSLSLREFFLSSSLIIGAWSFPACHSDAPTPGSGGASGADNHALAGSGAIGGSSLAGGPNGNAGTQMVIAGAGGTNAGGVSGANAGGVSAAGAAGRDASAGAGAAASGAGGASGASAGGGAGGLAGASSGTGCAGKTYKFCEDFESGTVSQLPTGWTSFKGYGADSPKDQQLASDQFHSGSKALKSTAGTKGTSRIQRSLSSLGATATKHWGRIFFKVQSPSATLPTSVNNGYLHTTFISMLGGSSENRLVDTVEMGPSHTYQWLYNLPSDAAGSGTESGYAYTFDDAWHCAEWYVDVGSMSYRFFYDSKEITQMAFSNKPAAQMASYTTIVVGTTYYQDTTLNPAFVAWFDDIAIDDQQIHCN